MAYLTADEAATNVTSAICAYIDARDVRYADRAEAMTAARRELMLAIRSALIATALVGSKTVRE